MEPAVGSGSILPLSLDALEQGWDVQRRRVIRECDADHFESAKRGPKCLKVPKSTLLETRLIRHLKFPKSTGFEGRSEVEGETLSEAGGKSGME